MRIRYWLLLFVLPIISGCQLGPHTSDRAVGEGFVTALELPSQVRAEGYFTPDAQIFLQGSDSPITRGRFQEYLDDMRRGKRAFLTGSRVFVTAHGVGWLLDINYVDGATPSIPPSRKAPPQLWMEALITERQITRLWIHFLVDAMPRLGIAPEAYAANAARHGIPVPDGWSASMPAIVAAAERADPLGEPATGWLVAASLVALAASGAMARMRWGRRRIAAVDIRRGGLMAKLADVRATRSVPG